MGDSSFREKLRKLDAENRKRVNELLLQEAMEKEYMYKTNPNVEPVDFPEDVEELDEDDLDVPETPKKETTKEEVKITKLTQPPKAKSSTSTRKKKTIMVSLFDEVVDWIEWKKDEGYSITAFCFKTLKKAMESDPAWAEYKNNNL